MVTMVTQTVYPVIAMSMAQRDQFALLYLVCVLASSTMLAKDVTSVLLATTIFQTVFVSMKQEKDCYKKNFKSFFVQFYVYIS